jgi:hypothetical protein
MKTLICQFMVMLTVGCGRAQTPSNPPVSPSRPPWSAIVNVADESGQPIGNADVEVSFYVPPPRGQTVAGDSFHGPTDENGIFRASHADTRSATLGFKITKPGYYTSYISHTLYQPGQFDEKTVKANRNSTFTVVLKKIGKPIAMYAKQVNLGMPVFGKPAGFDLMTGDWVAPYGRGDKADIIFTARLEKRAENDSDYTLTVSFPNPSDGIQEFNASPVRLGNGSELRSAQEAPVNDYQPQWEQFKTRRPGQPLNSNWDENRNFYFQVRTVLDEKGNIKSALYGKIYGDFMYFRYYLNPTTNSRNVEFDPKQNLLKGLKPLEQVNTP